MEETLVTRLALANQTKSSAAKMGCSLIFFLAGFNFHLLNQELTPERKWFNELSRTATSLGPRTHEVELN